MIGRKSFVVYKNWSNIFAMLNDEELGKLTRIIFDYANGQEVEIEDRVLKMAFENIRLAIDRDSEKYHAIVERNRENGKKGGAPKGNNNAATKDNPEQPKQPSGLSGLKKQPKQADSDSDSDSDSDNLSIERDWRKSFDIYQEYVRQGYQEAISDLEWMSKQQEFNPGIDIAKSIEKSCVNFWITHEGWANKRKGKAKTINWKTTFANAISNSINKVYLNKNGNEDKRASQFGV